MLSANMRNCKNELTYRPSNDICGKCVEDVVDVVAVEVEVEEERVRRNRLN